MDKNIVEDLFNDPQFKIIRMVNRLFGLWPFSSVPHRASRQLFIIALLLSILFLQIYGLHVRCGNDFILCCQYIVGVTYCIVISTKYFCAMIALKQYSMAYKSVTNLWLSITDPEEKSILRRLTKSGNMKYYFNFCFGIVSVTLFTSSVLVNVVLDYIIPLNESRERAQMYKGDFFFDEDKFFFEIHTYYSIIGYLTIGICLAIDSSYTVLMHQELGMFSITKHRLSKALNSKNVDYSCRIMISAVRIHHISLKFSYTCLMNKKTHTYTFLLFTSTIVAFASLSLLVILESDYNAKFRLWLLEGASVYSVAYLCFLGQLITQHSEDLLVSSYMSKWYEMPKKSKAFLKIIMIGFSRPCTMTAGGLFFMNFESLVTILRAVISYTAVALSFRR